MSFLINLYNLLVIHAIMLLGFPSSMLEWKYLSRFACYEIGGALYNVDIVLMYALCFLIFTNRLLRGMKIENYFDDFKPSTSEMTLKRQKYLSPTFDPRIHFLLCHHNVSSIPVRVVSPHNLHAHLGTLRFYSLNSSDLESATSEYIEKEIIVETKRKGNRVTLNMIFYWYQDDFFKFDAKRTPNRQSNDGNSMNDTSFSYSLAEMNLMAPFSLDWLMPEKHKKIAKIVDLKVRCVY